MNTISGSITGTGRLTGTLSPIGRLSGKLSYPGLTQRYDGEYEFTPGEEEQVVAIANLKATQNIIIHQIPSNYGLITYNGTSITVS